MKRDEHQPQRQHPRFPCGLELQASKLASLGTPQHGPKKTAIRGRLQNVSQGGVCLLSNQSIPTSSLVRCEIVVPRTRAAIPTLMRVRWAQKSSTNARYKIGLQFLM
jgi:c-di-GMP-binding flagellar brake protein YcgR